MRKHRPLFSRCLAILFAVLQLSSRALAVVADGQLDAQSFASASHVEAATGLDCARVHSPDCSLCQHVGSFGTCEARDAVLPSLRSHIESPVGRLGAFQTGLDHPSVLPRSPPLS